MVNTEVQGSIAFGRWVRQRRKMRDLTQEKLAEKVGCALETVRKIEGGRRRPSRQMATLLLAALGVQPGEIPAVVDLARLTSETDLPWPEIAPVVHSVLSGRGAQYEQRAQARSSLKPTGKLPALRTSLVGRAKELEAISSLLLREEIRLLTLYGPPGIGKTRLCIQAGLDLGGHFPDGVFFVPLSEVANPQMVIPEIARVLQLAEIPDKPLIEALSDYLYNKKALLLLDNFEQVLAAAPYVGNLLSTCPSIKVLVTSRSVLRIYGEIEMRVPALSLPRPNTLVDVEVAAQYEAVQLFVQRASAVDSTFQLIDENAPLVAEICRKLDALPLAIELAAAWCKVLSPAGIATRLDNNSLNLLKNGYADLPSRQQTLSSAVAWSYHLLPPAEARLFRRISIFSGGASVDAVEAICLETGDKGVLELLAGLLDASLLQRADDQHGESRFIMLATVRGFAADRLLSSGERDEIARRHALYYHGLASTSQSVLTSDRRQIWLDLMEAEHDNLRAALTWGLADEASTDSNSRAANGRGRRERRIEDVATGLRMAASLGWFWYFRGYFTEGRRWLDLAVQHAPSIEEWNIGAAAFNALARLAWCQSDYQAVLGAASQSLALAKSRQETDGNAETAESAYALTMLGITKVRQSDLAGGYPLLEQAVALFRKAGDPWALAFGLDRLADATTWREEYHTAACLYQESFGLFQQLGDTAGMAAELRELGNIALQLGDYEGAVINLEQALSLETSAISKWDRAHSLYSMAYAYQAMGDFERGYELYGQALELFQELGVRLGVAGALRNMGYLAMQRGDLPGAVDLYMQYLDHARDVNNEYSALICLAAVAGLLGRCEQDEAATELFSFVTRRCAGLNKDLPPFESIQRDEAVKAIRLHLAARVWERVWTDGQSMTLERAFGLAGSELMRLQHQIG